MQCDALALVSTTVRAACIASVILRETFTVGGQARPGRRLQDTCLGKSGEA